jgi:methionyl-tRNA formyltransferase
MLRIVFAGTPEFALPTLAALAASRHRLIGVLTQPDRPAGRGRASKPSAVKQRALELGLPLAQPTELRTPESRAMLLQWAPDLMVVVAYGLILPRAVLAQPRLGCINVHASLLPRWRGAAPIARAILAGDLETGVSIMQMEAGLDTGPVFATATAPIGGSSTSEQLHAQLAVLGAAELLATLDRLEAGSARPVPQAEHGVTYASKIERREALVDWAKSSEHIDRQVRAFNPWPVAETLWRGEQLRIWEATVASLAEGARMSAAVAGTVLALDPQGLQVACGQGVLAIRRLQLPGRRIVQARDFANAADPIGSRLGV